MTTRLKRLQLQRKQQQKRLQKMVQLNFLGPKMQCGMGQHHLSRPEKTVDCPRLWKTTEQATTGTRQLGKWIDCSRPQKVAEQGLALRIPTGMMQRANLIGCSKLRMTVEQMLVPRMPNETRQLKMVERALAPKIPTGTTQPETLAGCSRPQKMAS
jgi:hypothetical protein